MLERIVISLSILISYFLQTSVDFFRIGDIKPDFLLILTVYFALYRGSFTGLWVGFWSGLLQDINLGGVADAGSGTVAYFVGTHALPKTLVGYYVGKIASQIHRDAVILNFVLVLVSALIKGFLTYVIIAFFQSGASAITLVTILIPETIYTGVLSVAWLRLLRWAVPVPEKT